MPTVKIQISCIYTLFEYTCTLNITNLLFPPQQLQVSQDHPLAHLPLKVVSDVPDPLVQLIGGQL